MIETAHQMALQCPLVYHLMQKVISLFEEGNAQRTGATQVNRSYCVKSSGRQTMNIFQSVSRIEGRQVNFVHQN